MRTRPLLLLVPSLLLGLLAVDIGPAGALDTYTVTTTSDVVNGGDGVLSLREAVNAANADGDTSEINLANNATYQLTICDPGNQNELANASGDLNLVLDVAATINGNGSTVEQTCADEGVIFSTTDLTIEDLTVTGGDIPTGGGLTGGGINASQLTIRDSVVAGNSAEQGGGLAAYTLEMERTVVTANSAAIGGAITLTAPPQSMTARDSSITGNSATSVPGVHTTFSADVTLVNTTLTGNDATSFSASLGTELNIVGDLQLVHATLIGNADGPAVRASESLTSFGSVVTSPLSPCSTFNQGPTTTQGYNVASDTTCDFDDPTDEQSVGDVGLGPLADNGGAGLTFLPDPGGLLDDMIPVADCDPTVTADARGVARPEGNGCEPGAVEREAVRATDLHIRNASQATFGGNDVVNLTGAGQSRLQNRARGQKATFFVRFQNDGDAVDDVTVKGPASGSGFTVRYFAGTTNVTAAVVAGTHVLQDVAPAATRSIKVEVTVGQGPRNVTRNLLVRGTSVGDPTERDVVKASVKRT